MAFIALMSPIDVQYERETLIENWKELYLVIICTYMHTCKINPFSFLLHRSRLMQFQGINIVLLEFWHAISPLNGSHYS